MKRISIPRFSKKTLRPVTPRRLWLEPLEDRTLPNDLLSLMSGAFLSATDAAPVKPSSEPSSGKIARTSANDPLAFPEWIANDVLPSTSALVQVFPGDEGLSQNIEDPNWAGERAILPNDPGLLRDQLAALAGNTGVSSGSLGSGSHSGPGFGSPTLSGGLGSIGNSLSQAALEAMARSSGFTPAPPPLPPPPGPDGPSSGLNVTLLADTDRDGVVTSTDLPGRAEYTSTRGAIYNVNFDDDNSNGSPDAVNFNDSGQPINENFVIENETDSQDLAPLVIKAFGAGLTPDMQVFLSAGELEDAQSIHVFPSLTSGTTSILGSVGNRVGGAAAATSVNITSFVSQTEDVTFGVEGMFFRNTNTTAANTFDGQIDLTLEVYQSGSLVGQDTVRMKVAPWLMLPHTQDSLQIWAQNAGSISSTYLFSSSAQSGYYGLDDSGQLFTVTTGAGTQWFQDHVEIGYTQRPGGPATQMVFRLPYFRGTGIPQPTWPQIRMLGPNVGTFQIGVSLGAGAGDYGGNVEILPPTPAFPNGRIIHGNSGSAGLSTFFSSQEAQPLIQIPTRWLGVSHVDEIIGFTTTPNQVVIADPQDAFNRLEAIPEADRGRTVLFSTGRFPESGSVLGSNPTRIFTGVDHRGQNWGYLRIYDSSASGSNAAGQVARISNLGDGFIDIDRVWDTTSKIVDPVGGPSAMRWLLTATAPNTTTWFRNPQLGDQFVLVQGTRTWYDPNPSLATPAIITVQEMLADNEFRDLNLIDYQGIIDSIRTTLDNAAGGPGTLTFLKVPVLYVGRRAGFLTNRSASAITAGLQNFQPLGEEYYLPQQFGPRLASGSLSGPISFTTNDGDENPFNFTITGAVNTGALKVTELTPTNSGFTAEFNRPIDRNSLNLYNTETGGLGTADVTLAGSSGGTVRGSLVVDPSGARMTFVRTGGVLPPDNYTVTFTSDTNGFKDTAGGLLDGNGDGTPGDNYNYNFTVSASSAVVVSAPDFMRGPGQAVRVPAPATGIPLRLSDGAGVTSVQLTLRYNPALLTLTSAALGSSVPAGAFVHLATNTPGVAVLSFRSPTSLGAGAIDFVNLTATVPNFAPYRSQHVLDLTAISINNNAIAARDDDALHLVGYFGDTSGNGSYASIDATRALRVATGRDSGFLAYPLTDGVIVADINGNGLVNSTDSTRILQVSVGTPRPEIPEIPPIPTPTQPAPEIQVLTSGLDIVNHGTVDFGNAALGSTSTRTFTVRNNGTSTLTLGRLTVPYGYAIDAGFTNTTLLPGQQASFRVRMMTDGFDILETAANELVPGVKFVDCWNLYHRLLGEVHCGTTVMRDPYPIGWWNNLLNL